MECVKCSVNLNKKSSRISETYTGTLICWIHLNLCVGIHEYLYILIISHVCVYFAYAFLKYVKLIISKFVNLRCQATAMKNAFVTRNVARKRSKNEKAHDFVYATNKFYGQIFPKCDWKYSVAFSDTPATSRGAGSQRGSAEF